MYYYPENCQFFRYDYVNIYDGDSILEAELARLTGNSVTLEDRVTSTGPSIFINLETDGSEQRSGFMIEYNAGNEE